MGSEPAAQIGVPTLQRTLFALQLRARTQRPATHATSAEVIPREAQRSATQAMLHVAPTSSLGTEAQVQQSS